VLEDLFLMEVMIKFIVINLTRSKVDFDKIKKSLIF